MSPETVTIPGKASTVKVSAASSGPAHPSSHTSVMKFNDVKHLLSSKPLRVPKQKPQD